MTAVLIVTAAIAAVLVALVAFAGVLERRQRAVERLREERAAAAAALARREREPAPERVNGALSGLGEDAAAIFTGDGWRSP